jgi:hypothetical protein
MKKLQRKNCKGAESSQKQKGMDQDAKHNRNPQSVIRNPQSLKPRASVLN